jgi:hypothetical protein
MEFPTYRMEGPDKDGDGLFNVEKFPERKFPFSSKGAVIVPKSDIYPIRILLKNNQLTKSVDLILC